MSRREGIYAELGALAGSAREGDRRAPLRGLTRWDAQALARSAAARARSVSSATA